MNVFTISSQEELDKLIEEQEALNYQLAAVSNAGLPKGQYRATFLPNSAFNKPSDERIKADD